MSTAERSRSRPGIRHCRSVIFCRARAGPSSSRLDSSASPPRGRSAAHSKPTDRPRSCEFYVCDAVAGQGGAVLVHAKAAWERIGLQTSRRRPARALARHVRPGLRYHLDVVCRGARSKPPRLRRTPRLPKPTNRHRHTHHMPPIITSMTTCMEEVVYASRQARNASRTRGRISTSLPRTRPRTRHRRRSSTDPAHAPPPNLGPGQSWRHECETGTGGNSPARPSRRPPCTRDIPRRWPGARRTTGTGLCTTGTSPTSCKGGAISRRRDRRDLIHSPRSAALSLRRRLRCE